MNLGDFEKTNFSGLYISKESYQDFGNKYIARFQHNKKRYVKVLGYTIKDNLTRKDAITFEFSTINNLLVFVNYKIKVTGDSLRDDNSNDFLTTLDN